MSKSSTTVRTEVRDHSSPDGAFRFRIEPVEGDIWRIVQWGWADRESGSVLVEALGGILDDLGKRGDGSRLWLCADYSEYGGTDAMVRQRMLRRVVEHEAFGGVAFHGTSRAAQAMATLLVKAAPRLRIHACSSEEAAMAWLRKAASGAESRIPDPEDMRKVEDLPILLVGEARRRVLEERAELKAFRRSRDLMFDYIVSLCETEEQLQQVVAPPSGVLPDDPLFASFAAILTFQKDIQELLAERNRQMAELATAWKTADAACRARSEFLGIVSHELRTPLSAVSGYASLLGITPLDVEQRSAVDGISDAASRLARMVDELLDVTRLETGSLSLLPAPFSLDRIPVELHGCFAARAVRQGIGFVVDMTDGLPTGSFAAVMGDRDRLLQILSNLVDNALKFTTVGEVRVTIRPVEADRVFFEVRDTGIGIAPQDRERIFERFVRGSARIGELSAGLGIGLSVARDLVRVMGGTLRLVSEEAVGSRFCFEIPLPPVALPEPMRVAVPRDRNPRVLVVEDDPSCRVIAQKLLQKHGCTVFLASDGHDAVHCCATLEPDLVLMDLQLPGLSGMDATRAIRTAERARDSDRRVVIVATTAHGFDESGEEAIAAGMDGFASKPLGFFALGNLLRRYLPAFALPPACPTLRVLIVDDDPLVQEVFGRMVEACDAIAVSCLSVGNAIKTVEEEPFDLLMVDYSMPEMNGLDCLEAILRMRPGIRSVIVSGSRLSTEDGQRARLLGVRYLMKPITLSVIREMLAEIGRGPQPPGVSCP